MKPIYRALGLNRLILNMIGIWPKEKTISSSNLQELRALFMVEWMLICYIFPMNYALIQIIKELPLVIDNLTTYITTLTSMVKLYLLWKKRKSNKLLQIKLKFFYVSSL